MKNLYHLASFSYLFQYQDDISVHVSFGFTHFYFICCSSVYLTFIVNECLKLTPIMIHETYIHTQSIRYMSHLIYKVSNLHFFKQCETFNSYLYPNNLLFKYEFIHYGPLKWKLFHPHTLIVNDTLTTSHALQRNMPSDHHQVRKTLIQGVIPILESSTMIYHWWIMRRSTILG